MAVLRLSQEIDRTIDEVFATVAEFEPNERVRIVFEPPRMH
jgi:hypothetical protein